MGRPAQRQTCEESLRINAFALARLGVLRPGIRVENATLRWSSYGERIAEIEYDIDTTCMANALLTLRFRADGMPVKQLIDIVPSPMPWPGSRLLFECPGLAAECGRRQRILYLHAGRFACRRCHRLIYESQRASSSFFESMMACFERQAMTKLRAKEKSK